ncbi:MAG: lytic murein transglycosylase [Acidovorax sp.]
MKYARISLAGAALALIAGCASTPQPAQAPTPPAPTPSVPATPAPAAPPSTDAEQAGFAAWIAEVSRDAIAAGIRPATVQQTLGQAEYLPRVIELDRAQPEFTRTPWAYLDAAVSAQRIAQGQAQRAEYQAPLEAAAARYGVPSEVVTAVWGMESNYGQNFGDFRTVDALATLGYEGRRRDWARGELLAALRIADQGDIAPERMVGSWAGAMGHTQFLPSVYLAYAVDADGDGRRDIWGSVPDVAASTANFLRHSGWQSDEPWGVEVQLPPGFDYARAELTVRRDSTVWAVDGVRGVNGAELPTIVGASILTPAGARGPAFMVGRNFRALLRYNNSTNYALAVGLLSRQIAGGPGVAAPWPRDLEPLSRAQVRDLQAALNQRGFAAGQPDGVAGPATRAGLRQYQQSVGAVADGYPTAELLRQLLAQ